MHPSRPLIGRSRELDALAGALLRGGGGMRVVAVSGEPGIGKTRLLEEIAAVAHGRRVRVGRSSELERDTPFAPVADAFHAFDDAERSRIAAMRDDQRDRLAAIFPALADLGQPGGVGLQRYHAQHAIHRMLEVLTRRVPMVLALDDLHWADDASLELLAHLLRRPPDAPLALVLAYRPAELAREVHGLLDRIQVIRLDLAPLSREEARELVGPGVAADRQETLYRESGGNPLFLEHLARGGVGERDPGLPGVPAAVRRVLAAELDALPPDARLAAHAGAVLGETFSLDLVARVAELESPAAAVDALVDADLVRPAVLPLLRFRHPIVRRAIYEDAPPAWRTAAHARADAALAIRGASPLERAPHVERSAAQGNGEAVSVLVAAGGASAPHAPAIAARWFEAARRLMPPGQPEELALLPHLGMCLGLSGRLRESRDVLGEALEGLAAIGAPAGELTAFAAGVDHFLGRHEDARALIENALREAPPGGPDAATLVSELAWDHWFQGDWREIARVGEEALAAARAAGEPTFEAIALAFVSLGETSHGNVEVGESLVREAAGIVDALDDAALAPRLQALFAVTVAEGLSEDFEGARRHGARGAALARLSGQETRLVMFEGGAALAETYLGELQSAGSHLAVALEISRLYRLDHLLGWTESIHSLWLLRSGRSRDARDAYERSERAFAAMALEPPLQQACECAEAWLETMTPAETTERLLATVGGPDLEQLPPRYRTYACELLCRAAPTPEAAAAWAARAREYATSLPVCGQASALRAEAHAALDARPAAAAELALRAAASAETRGARLDALASRQLAGEALARSGEAERAVAEFETVHRVAIDCDARGFRDRAAAELRRLGTHVGRPGPAPRRGTGLAALSRREREVAQLVADRLTNREIAERLVLSPKTVERHLSRIYATLEISSRVELARRVESG